MQEARQLWAVTAADTRDPNGSREADPRERLRCDESHSRLVLRAEVLLVKLWTSAASIHNSVATGVRLTRRRSATW